jgi:hypothetical protein
MTKNIKIKRVDKSISLWEYLWTNTLVSSLVGARVAQWVRSLDLTIHTSLSPIRRRFAPGFVNYKKGCTRLADVSDKVYQLLAHGRWFSPGTPASSTTKTGFIKLILSIVRQKKSTNTSTAISDLIFLFWLLTKKEIPNRWITVTEKIYFNLCAN